MSTCTVDLKHTHSFMKQYNKTIWNVLKGPADLLKFEFDETHIYRCFECSSKTNVHEQVSINKVTMLLPENGSQISKSLLL